VDETTFESWIRAFRPGSAQYDVLLLLGGLRHLTGWEENTLCRHLGCEGLEIHRTHAARTAHSRAYLRWVTELCEQVDPSQEQVRSRREVVVAAYELCDGAGGPVTGRVERCGAAMLHPVGGDLSGLTLLRLGEIPAAFAQAARALPDGPAREERDRFDAETPHFQVGHLHVRRLELLLTGNAQTIQQHLGATVALRMHDHLRECTRCQAAADERGLEWHARPLAMTAA
jgi:hypothetical protein